MAELRTYALLSHPKVHSFVGRMFPWKVAAQFIPIGITGPEPFEVPWVINWIYDMREPFQWCREHVGSTAIVGSRRRIGRQYTAIDEHGDHPFASVGPSFFFRDQWAASAFRLIYG